MADPMAFMQTPATGAMLYALELPPPEGGTTCWADLSAVYAGLPDRLKRAVEGRRAIFDYTRRLAGCQGVDRVISEEAKRKAPPVLHPLVHIHPITGRKALYLDSTTTTGIDGMQEASGSARSRRSTTSRRGPSSSIATIGRSAMRCYGTIASPCIAASLSTPRRGA